jgi:apolipoprotein N-acyltransferase
MRLKFPDFIFALLSGFVTALAFPKFGLQFFLWISLIPLLFLISRLTPRRAFLISWIAGTVFYMLLLYWIPAVPAHYGNLSTGFSILIYIFLAVLLALSWALFGLTFSVIRGKFGTAVFYLAPLFWVSFEYIITHLLTGFPWGILGTSQFKNLSFIQISTITGVYGLSFVLVFFQSMFVYSIRSGRRLPFALALILMSVIHLAGFLSLRQVAATPESFEAAVIQGNVSSDIYWNEIQTDRILELFKDHIALTKDAYDKGAKLIIWPEFTIPLCFSCEDALYRNFSRILFQFVQDTQAMLLLGTNETSGSPGEEKYFNTAVGLTPDLKMTKYAKMHLVPFGEYTPYKAVFGFIQKMTHAIGEVTPGTAYVLHAYDGRKFGSPICYEVIFPDLVRRFTKKGANFLVTITNDGWYGKTSAPYQHFAQAILRAVENRRFMLRAATTGISGIIDPYGRVIAQTEIMTKTFLTGKVTPREDLTFYARFGDLFSFICLTAAGGAFILALFKRPT